MDYDLSSKLSDLEIAEVFLGGIELTSRSAKERYDALKALNKGLKRKLQSFRDTFETTLEEKLTEEIKRRDEILTSLNKYCGDCAISAWKRVYREDIYNPIFMQALSKPTELTTDYVHQRTELLIYITSNLSHAKTVKKNLKTLKRIELDPDNDVYLERDGDPQILPPSSHPQFGLFSEGISSSPFFVGVNYTGKIPRTMLLTVHEKHKTQLQKP